tara:strand:+ start:871 stop:1710 length:840 start_codon:yes stop_codon:yes gene_type:complete
MEKWDKIIKPERNFFQFNFLAIFNYKDLIFMFIKRDFVTYYKQTLLGPLWYLIQPLVNTIVFTIIFGNLAKIPTDGLPPFLFYMAGNVIWGYFSICLVATSNTFVSNAGIFSKVYFPRLIVPISNILFSLLQFIIQFAFFMIFFVYFYLSGSEVSFSYKMLFLPLLVFHVALLSLGCGTILSSLTAKYRDLTLAMTFLVQIWLYATPIVYPLSLIPESYQIIACLNPMTAVVELFREIFLGKSTINFFQSMISISMTLVLVFVGLLLFNRVEKNFVDTV